MSLPFDTGSTPVTFVNTAGEDCPPHAILTCHGFEYDSANKTLKIKCRKPTAEDVAESNTVYAFNGPAIVSTGKLGSCVMARHAAQWAKVDPDYDYGEFDPDTEYFVLRIGPIANQWYVSRDGTGFVLVGARDDSGAIQKGRVLVLQDIGASNAKYAIVTQTNSALDNGSISVNCLATSGEDYIEGKFCDKFGNIVDGSEEGQADGTPIKLRASKSFPGLLCQNVVCCVVRRSLGGDEKIFDAIYGGGIAEFTGVVKTATHPDYEVYLPPYTGVPPNASVTGALGGAAVPAVSEHDDEFSVGQKVSCVWEYKSLTVTQIRICDFSCPPVSTGLGVG